MESSSLIFSFFFAREQSFGSSSMGSAIEKVAFMPPDPSYTRSALGSGRGKPVQYVTNSLGTKVSFVHFQQEISTPNQASGSSGAVAAGRRQVPRTPFTMLFCHGNAEDIGRSYQGFVQLHRETGTDIVAFDYSGYGLSEGKSSEKAAYADVDAVFNYMISNMGIPREKIIIVGRSLGSGVATELAAKERGAAGLILLSPLTSAVRVVGKAAAFVLYFNDIFANVRKIEKVTDYPVLIVHGKRDEVVPFSHGAELFELVSKVNQRASCLWLEQCGHNDIEALEPHQFFAQLRNFIADLGVPCPAANPGSRQQAGASCFSSCS
jgi:pimeloyl-ACP methyl ester carboxylesterase